MKVIICGSRNITNISLLDSAIKESGFLPYVDELVSGGAPGVDRCCELWAKTNGKDLVIFPANWNKYGKPAGPIRNQRMLKYVMLTANEFGLIAVWDGKSRGTKSMIKMAKEHTDNVFVKIL